MKVVCSMLTGQSLVRSSWPRASGADKHVVKLFLTVGNWSNIKINPCVIPNSLEDLGRFLYRNPPEHQLSAPEPTGTSSAFCTGTRRNLISHRRNRPEPCQVSAPEPSGTSSAFCAGTLRNLLRNLLLQLHRIAPELFWAKDPIASFAVGKKRSGFKN